MFWLIIPLLQIKSHVFFLFFIYLSSKVSFHAIVLFQFLLNNRSKILQK